MTEKEELKFSIKNINAEIAKLTELRTYKENRLISLSTNFKEKFQAWYFGSSEGYHDWMPNEEDFPLLSEYLDKCDFNRYNTYDIVHVIGEEILGLFESDNDRQFFDSDEEYQLEIEKYQPLMEEIMNHDLKTFKCDW